MSGEIRIGSRWHSPAGHTSDNPAARSFRIVGFVSDERTGERLIVTAEWFRHKRRHHYEIEPLWLFEYGVKHKHCARGPLPKGKQS